MVLRIFLNYVILPISIQSTCFWVIHVNHNNFAKIASRGWHNALNSEVCVRFAHMGPRDEDLLTVAEVARIWHVSISTVHRWITEGKLNAVQLPSGRYRIRASDAEAALRETKERPPRER
jgi:excisionase family DNA binding protein